MGLNLAAVLRDSAARSPAALAMCAGSTRMSYRELDDAACRFAGVLARRGIGVGDRVGIMLPNVCEFAVAYFGTLIAGAAVVPMNVLLKEREVAFYLEDSSAALLVAWHEVLDEARAGARSAGGVPVIAAGGPAGEPGSLPALLDAATPAGDAHDHDANAPAVVLYTSGTTGKPKGAVLTHSNLLWNAQVSAELFALGPQDVLLGTLPLFHSFGQTCVMNAAFRRGAAVVAMARFEPQAAWDLIEQEAITVFAGVPTMYVALMHADGAAERDVSALRLCVSGGAAIALEVLRGFEAAFGCRILEGYGLSETSPVATFNHLDRPSKPGSIGTPIWGTQIRVADDHGEAVRPGEVGEILIRGHNVMAGYLGRPEETAAAITADGWLRTGDMARADEDGYLFIVDRKKDLIIRGGYNVYPREIEEVLYEHPDIVEAAVLGAPHEELGEEVVAAIVARPGAAIDAEEVKGFVRARLAAYKYPRRVMVVDELPKGPTGKILKREIAVTGG